MYWRVQGGEGERPSTPVVDKTLQDDFRVYGTLDVCSAAAGEYGLAKGLTKFYGALLSGDDAGGAAAAAAAGGAGSGASSAAASAKPAAPKAAAPAGPQFRLTTAQFDMATVADAVICGTTLWSHGPRARARACVLTVVCGRGCAVAWY